MERPKRRKSKDNPYTLENIGLNKWKVKFNDSSNKERNIEINSEIYNAMNNFELEDKSQMNRDERHKEQSDVCEITLWKRAVFVQESVEDQIIKKIEYEELMIAVNELPEIQKRRIRKYYFENKTQQQIADEEGVDIRAIQYTLNIALKKLKEILK